MSLSTRLATEKDEDILLIFRGFSKEHNEVDDVICTAAVKILVKYAD